MARTTPSIGVPDDAFEFLIRSPWGRDTNLHAPLSEVFTEEDDQDK